MCSFWNYIKRQKKRGVNSTVTANDFADYYSTIMTDDLSLSSEQQVISDFVQNCHLKNMKIKFADCNISTNAIISGIRKLKRNCSPGHDSITTEHLVYGESAALCVKLACFYSSMLRYSMVPSIFNEGLIVPVLKKSTLNPNEATSYRIITLLPTFAKLMEI